MNNFESGHLNYISPPEDEVVAYDWNESEIYAGQWAYNIEESDGKRVRVLEDDLKNYIEHKFGEAEEME